VTDWNLAVDVAIESAHHSIDCLVDAALHQASVQAVANRAAWDLRQQHYTRSIGQILRHVRRRVRVRTKQ
jgi:hypothetical protein